MREEPVRFYSGGERLEGALFLPEEASAARPGPGVVLCAGFGGVKELYLPDNARRLAQAGYVSLTFDYRGFGASGGKRGRLFPLAQVEDIRNAVTFLGHRPEVDSRRIGLYGTSFGGANVSYAAAHDPRVACTVSVVGIGDGERWLRSLRRLWEWDAFLARVEEARRRRVLAGEETYVDPFEVMVRDPATEAEHQARAKRQPLPKWELLLESAEHIIAFKPEATVARIAPRPILFIHSERDVLVSPDESRRMYAASGEPKKLLLLPGAAHYDVYHPPTFDAVMDAAVGWYGEFLKGQRGG
ncbi:MAG: alpha/beta hydrolase [Nitrospinota bacterium]